MKDSYGFESKNLAREKLRNFVAKHYSEGQRKNLKVLTLLGHEDHELKQIWDPLGIPRQNITVVEGNKEPYEILKNSNFGINLVQRQSIEDFVKDTNKKFDIMNLDYQGYLNPEKERTLKLIPYREILNEKGILSTWFFGKREKGEAKIMIEIENLSYLEGIGKLLDEYTFEDSRFEPEIISKLVDAANSRFDSLKENQIRSDYISNSIIGPFKDPILNFEHHPFVNLFNVKEEYFKFLGELEIVKTRNKKFLEFILKREEFPLHRGIYSKESFEDFKRIRALSEKKEKIPKDLKENLLRDFTLEGALNFILPLIERKIKGALKNTNLKYNESFIRTCSYVISSSLNNPFFLKDSERYFYKGDKGAPMYVDFNLFKREDISFLKWKINDGKINFKLSSLKDKDLIKKLLDHENLHKEFASQYLFKKNERINLEPQKKITESVPQTKNLSKEQVYSLLREGKTDNEILLIDPDQNPKSIPCYRAHITMEEQGIQRGRPAKSKLEETLVEPIQKIKVDRKEMTKDEAIEYLRAGFTPEEVYQYSPESFKSVHQVAAWKSWYVTMGKEEIAA